jgi:16S rRNA (guanine966-N2)-methyltransferase
MRITGGKARGISLRVPAGPVRPATDYLREAIFSSLAAWVPQAQVLDLFAGTGAYGLESISRGAAAAVAVDEITVPTLNANAAAVAKSMGLEKLPFEAIKGDARRYDSLLRKFDLVFMDPPWDMWEREADLLVSTAAAAAAPGEHTRLILEAPGGLTLPVAEGWRLHKVLGKGKGQPAASIFRRL